jgi:hypothetical protein
MICVKELAELSADIIILATGGAMIFEDSSMQDTLTNSVKA